MATHGTKRELEARRMIAADMFEQGLGPCEVARRLGATEGAASQWKTIWEREGKTGLRAKPHPGGKSRMNDEQRHQLVELLLAGPRANGFSTDLWTLPRMADLIEREMGICYHSSHVSRILADLGWSPQKPERLARERDEEAIQRWRDQDWPRIKKKRAARVRP